MNRTDIEAWLKKVNEQSNGDITAVQTLRNAIMAASVLASTALVALMGVLATILSNTIFAAAAAAGCLVLSCFFSLRTIWLLAALSFHLQQLDLHRQNTAQQIASSLNAIRYAAVFLTLALAVSAVGVLLKQFT